MNQLLQHREPTQSELDMATEALLGARVMRPYYAVAIAPLKPLAVDGLGTIAVDPYWRLYIDFEWFSALSLEKRAYVITAHEIEHLLRRHHKRCGPRDHNLFNICGDCEINDDADKSKLPDGAVLPSLIGQPDNLTAEEYYRDLPQDTQPNGKGCGSGAGGPRQEYEKEGGAGEDGIDEVSGDGIRTATANAVKDYVQKNGKGSVPAGVEVWADDELKHMTPPWPRLMRLWISSAHKEACRGRMDYSYRKLHRRQQANQVIRPSLIAYNPKIVAVADTSGSMGNEGAKVLGVLASIKRLFPSVIILDCDVAVTRYTKGKHIGGGGTSMTMGIEAALKMKADGIIVITDGYTDWPSKPAVPVIVAITTKEATPDWAERLEIE